MRLSTWYRTILVLPLLILVCVNTLANEALFKEARGLQRDGKYEEAIVVYKSLLTQPIDEKSLTDEQLFFYTEALVQLMNTYQSMGEAEACIATLQEVYSTSVVLQKECLRDYYSVLGYALSRTESMQEAEATMLRVFTFPLYRATPERYFRDYAYAAAVFYSNPNYQKEVIGWCREALIQAELSENTSGAQWVEAMLGSLYKRNGHLNEALELLHKSKNEAEQRGDGLGVLNSLNALTDLFLYWDIPEYANIYATEAVRIERNLTMQNPMVSAQTYINKGRALQHLGEIDSVSRYTEKARRLCEALPYNSGMVDVNLLSGSCLIAKGGDSLRLGLIELQQVAQQGTAVNRARAYHHLAQAYLRTRDNASAEAMLDSLHSLLGESDVPIHIGIDYEPIIDHYLATNNHHCVEQYVRLMLQEQQAFKERSLKFNLVESIVEMQTEQKSQELKMVQLKLTNQRLWFSIGMTIAIIVIAIIAITLYFYRGRSKIELKRVNDRFAQLSEELNKSNTEKEKITQEIKEFLMDNDNRQELETITPYILKEGGETKFRQCFELLYPLFLPRLREKVPSITRREELLSMLIVLKQNNKEIAELLAIAPRSVLMLRHRFRQKIGMSTELSLEYFVEDLLGVEHGSGTPSDNTTQSKE